MHPCAIPDPDLLGQCRWESQRAGGPGGQHANKTESGVRLVNIATGIQAASTNHREKLRNQAEALLTLRLRLAIQIRGGADPAWLQPHRRGRALSVGVDGPGFPRVVAVLLDALAESQGALVGAAGALALSSTQLAGVLTRHPEVRQAADAMRHHHGLGALHVR